MNVVHDLLAVVDTYGLDRVDLLGFSYDGRLLQLFAERYPERLRSLVLASTSAYDGDRQTTHQQESDAWHARSSQCPAPAWPESLDGDLVALSPPTLVLHGEFDLTFPAQVAVDLVHDVCSAQLVIISGAGHMAPI